MNKQTNKQKPLKSYLLKQPSKKRLLTQAWLGSLVPDLQELRHYFWGLLFAGNVLVLGFLVHFRVSWFGLVSVMTTTSSLTSERKEPLWIVGFETCRESPAFYLGLWNWKHFLACIFQVGALDSNLFSKPVLLESRAQEDSLKCVLLWSSILCSCADVSLSHCVFLSTNTLKFALWKMNKFFKYLKILFLCKLLQIRTGNKSSLNKILKKFFLIWKKNKPYTSGSYFGSFFFLAFFFLFFYLLFLF